MSHSQMELENPSITSDDDREKKNVKRKFMESFLETVIEEENLTLLPRSTITEQESLKIALEAKESFKSELAKNPLPMDPNPILSNLSVGNYGSKIESSKNSHCVGMGTAEETMSRYEIRLANNRKSMVVQKVYSAVYEAILSAKIHAMEKVLFEKTVARAELEQAVNLGKERVDNLKKADAAANDQKWLY